MSKPRKIPTERRDMTCQKCGHIFPVYVWSNEGPKLIVTWCPQCSEWMQRFLSGDVTLRCSHCGADLDIDIVKMVIVPPLSSQIEPAKLLQDTMPEIIPPAD